MGKVLIVLAIIAAITADMYNKLVYIKNKVRQARSGVDVYLKQRFDLIPNLEECVKGYSQHEKETLEKIIQLRNDYTLSEHADIKKEEVFNKRLNEIIITIESYPQLMASNQYMKLQKSLIKIESQVQAARRIYNNEVTCYNTKISVFPTNIFAKVFHFKEEMLFEIEATQRENIKIG